MNIIKQKYIINSKLESVWAALVDPKIIDKWGGGPSKMSDKKNFRFSLWGGSVWGKNLEVIPDKKLVQEWFSDSEKKWDKPSKVTFLLLGAKDKTTLQLIQEEVPEWDLKNISDGWRDYYLGPLKSLLEKNFS